MDTLSLVSLLPTDGQDISRNYIYFLLFHYVSIILFHFVLL